MPTNVTVGGNTYPVALYGETGWAQGSGNLSQLLIALAAQTASTPAFMQVVAVSASPQTVTTGKTYLTNTQSTAITFNLPTPAANVWFMIKDTAGNAGVKNMTLNRSGSEKIDGVASNATLSVPYGLTIVASDGTDWYILLNV